MTKKNIARAISVQTGLPIYQTHCVIQRTIDAIVATVIDEQRLELRGFGVFEVRKRAARRARNPRTGERLVVPEKLKVTFRPSRDLIARMQMLAAAPDAACAASSTAGDAG